MLTIYTPLIPYIQGVQTLLDAIIDYMPSPLDRPAITGVDANNIEKVC